MLKAKMPQSACGLQCQAAMLQVVAVLKAPHNAHQQSFTADPLVMKLHC
jgi:hypothetical protein